MNRMRDDQDFNIRFVEIIKNERCLYDKTMPEYRSKDEHDRVWQKVANEANDTVSHCKERWRNLRACLTRHLKNNKRQQGSSVESDTFTYHKPYYLAEHMEFLLPFTRSRSQTNASYDVNVDEFVKREQTVDHDDDSSEGLDELSMALMQPATVDSTSAPNNPINKAKYLSSGETSEAKRSFSVMNDSIGNKDTRSVVEVPESKRICKTEIIDPKEIEDADINFFKSLLPDIRQMSASQKRKFKMGIFELINNIFDN